MAANPQVIDMSDLKDLEPLSKRLNTATDEFTQILESIQNRLNALSLGVEAWVYDEPLSGHYLTRSVGDEWVELDGVPVTSWSENDVERVKRLRSVTLHRLGYGRVGDGWALLVGSFRQREIHTGARWDPEEDSETESDRKPLLRSARHLRVEAIAEIPRLVDQIKAEAERVIAAVEQAKQIAASLK